MSEQQGFTTHSVDLHGPFDYCEARRIESFPHLLLANLFGFTPAEYFEFEDSLTK